ncbi:MAG: GGDEF domain-containing protein, partial [Clostridia bacterium]|nr:GGDEF domain-containing protein [Clostridia bacterium]
NAMDIAATTSTFLEKDLSKYIELFSVNDYSTDEFDKAYYFEMLALFQELKNETHVNYIFTEKKISDSEIAYILDGENPDSEYFSPIGSLDSISEEELIAFNDGVIISTDLVLDEVWGNFVTGFAPIIAPQTGEAYGLVGVDYSYDFIAGMVNSVKTLIIYSFFAMMLLISFAVEKLFSMNSLANNKDFLTGLYSKNYHQAKLKKYIRESKKSGDPLSLMMIDVDHFKSINDHYGHPVGDKVLKSVALMLLKDIRKADTCSRFGGDEFVIVLPNTTLSDAAQIGERIRKRIYGFDLNVEDVNQLQLSISIGIAQLENNMSPEKLLEYADQAMYVSKNTGKNKITLYNVSM